MLFSASNNTSRDPAGDPNVPGSDPARSAAAALATRMALCLFLVSAAWQMTVTAGLAHAAARGSHGRLAFALLTGALGLAFSCLVLAHFLERQPRHRVFGFSLGFFAIVGALWPLLPLGRGDSSFPALLAWAVLAGGVLVTQCWALADDVLGPRQARKLLGRVVSGAILGGSLGGPLAAALALTLDEAAVMPVSAALLLAAVPVVLAIHRQDLESEKGYRPGARPITADDARVPRVTDGFRLALGCAHLRAVFALGVFSAATVALLDFQVASLATAALGRAGNSAGVTAGGGQDRSAVVWQVLALGSGGLRPGQAGTALAAGAAAAGGTGSLVPSLLALHALQTLAALLVQGLGVALLLGSAGLRAVLALPAALVLGCSLLLVAWPTLLFSAAVAAMAVALETSLFTTGRELLYLPGTREDKYKAKLCIDGLARALAGAAVAGGALLLSAGGLPHPRLLPLAAAGLAAAWLVAGFRAHRAHLDHLRSRLDRCAAGVTQTGSGFFQRLIATEGGTMGEPTRQKLALELGNFFLCLAGRPEVLDSAEAARKLEKHQDRQWRRIFALLGQLEDPRDIGRAYSFLRTMTGAPRELALELLDELLTGRERKLVLAVADEQLPPAERAAVGARLLRFDRRAAREYVEGLLRC